jgi:hypothetical protein
VIITIIDGIGSTTNSLAIITIIDGIVSRRERTSLLPPPVARGEEEA